MTAIYITTDEFAARLRLKRNTIEHWRKQGRGPKHTKLGRRVLYKLADVEAWERANGG